MSLNGSIPHQLNHSLRELKPLYRIHPGSQTTNAAARRVALLVSKLLLENMGKVIIHYAPELRGALFEGAKERKLQCDEIPHEWDKKGKKVDDALKFSTSIAPDVLWVNLAEVLLKILISGKEESHAKPRSYRGRHHHRDRLDRSPRGEQKHPGKA